jgi:hypothetical protein
MAQSSRAFLKRKGSIKVGPGDPVEDVRKARELMGTGLPPGDGAFDSGHTDTAAGAEEVLGELGFGRKRR